MDYKEKVIALLNSQELSKEQKEMLETIFPELKESEDEKIRKELIEKVKETPACIGFNDKKAVLAWLEKQGEQKPIWTDNDRTMAFTLLRDVDQMTYISKGGKNERLQWLNSLEEKFTRKEKPADGDDLPEIDREVIVLIKYNAQRNIHDEEYPTYRVGFGHRPNPDGWDGRNIDTNVITHYTPKLHDKGGWNAPNIAYWLDIELPKEIEL